MVATTTYEGHLGGWRISKGRLVVHQKPVFGQCGTQRAFQTALGQGVAVLVKGETGARFWFKNRRGR